MNQPPHGLLLAGEIGKPHGVSGEVYVVPVSDDPNRFRPGARLIHDDGRTVTVQSSRRHRGRLLVKFQGADTRADAEGLRGGLHVREEDLRELGDDEYWGHLLVGAAVTLRGGEAVGRITRVVPAPAQDLLAVDTPAGERLVPAVKDIVVQVDVEGRRVVIDPPEGLLD